MFDKYNPQEIMNKTCEDAAKDGWDLSCGGCAELFFTGVGMSPCVPGCKTIPKRGGNVVVTFGK